MPVVGIDHAIAVDALFFARLVVGLAARYRTCVFRRSVSGILVCRIVCDRCTEQRAGNSRHILAGATTKLMPDHTAQRQLVKYALDELSLTADTPAIERVALGLGTGGFEIYTTN